eukprot:scaffold30730_cov31-Tisochrysis_lutea.AAC.7
MPDDVCLPVGLTARTSLPRPALSLSLYNFAEQHQIASGYGSHATSSATSKPPRAPRQTTFSRRGDQFSMISLPDAIYARPHSTSPAIPVR